ncbi:MAG: hypothetical protein M0037_09255, partial [Betaproteobacteria bacterium]|nr:hypothetical protein [Betaproteobacteria bacterium]
MRGKSLPHLNLPELPLMSDGVVMTWDASLAKPVGCVQNAENAPCGRKGVMRLLASRAGRSLGTGHVRPRRILSRP